MSQLKNARSKVSSPLILTVAAAGLLAGAGLVRAQGSGGPAADGPAAVTLDAKPSEVDHDPPDAMILSDGFVELAERVTPAVVRIEVRMGEGREQRATPDNDLSIPEPFRRFFDGPNGQDLRPEPGPRMGGGTGFIISQDGYIVTNEHVVGDADQITVYLEDRRSFEAELIGKDPTTDVAVIKIDADDLPMLAWGSSADLRVGEWVMAVGNPGIGGAGQLDYTVTTGIVSAKGRPLQLLNRSLREDPEYGDRLAGYAIENFIQTDAVINPGNSGGPMVDLTGSVVGINSAIASTSGYYQGYGFAIPSDLARKIAEDLIRHGSIQRGWLGVTVTGVTVDDAEVYDLPDVAGVLVQSVSEDSPAEQGGLRSEDVIVSVDGEAVDRAGHLQQLIAQQSPGDRVELDIHRDGKARTLTVELGEAPINAARSAKRASGEVSTRLGFGLADLTPGLAERYRVDDARGVVITDVDPYGPAARQGIAPGLKLVAVDRTEVDDAAEARDLIGEHEAGEVVSLLLETPSGQTRVVNLRIR